MKLLLQILSTKRKHGSKGDLNFRAWLLKKLTRFQPKIMGVGNIVVTLGTSKTLFSCHVDSVHSMSESNGSKQRVAYDPDFNAIFLADKAGCLGADDGNGIWIMLMMIRAGVPGTYVFHVGEEVGGIGSKSMADNHADWLSQFDRAVAFDRAVHPGTPPEVITHQGGLRGASDEFGEALATALNQADPTLGFEPSDGGVYTDTAEYTGIIPECVNVGCFYEHQHSPDEWVDVGGLTRLVEACIKIKWEDLPTKRDPNVDDFDDLYLTPWFTSSKPKVDVKPEVLLEQIWQARIKYESGERLSKADIDLVDTCYASEGLALGFGEYPDKENELAVALDEWWHGHGGLLVDVLAVHIRPEEPSSVEHLIRLGNLTPELALSAIKNGAEVLVDTCVRIN